MRFCSPGFVAFRHDRAARWLYHMSGRRRHDLVCEGVWEGVGSAGNGHGGGRGQSGVCDQARVEMQSIISTNK
jgi:hypothetical protein